MSDPPRRRAGPKARAMRRYFCDPDRPNQPGLPLSYPGPDILRRIPDDWTVWAFTDTHGMLAGLTASLRRAGLIDVANHWIGAPATALVGVGDYIDRGPDSAGVVDLLTRLSKEAATAGSRIVLVRGNHEQMLLDLLRGDPEWFGSWLANGGRPFLSSYGLAEPLFGPPLARLLDQHAAALREWLRRTLPYAIWRNVLFVHAGPIVGGCIADLEDGDLQLWKPDTFAGGAGLLDSRFARYVDDGIGRVVVGHVPQDGGPTLVHDGKTLLLDANACGLQPANGGRRTAYSCLVRLTTDGALGDSTFVLVEEPH